MEEPIDPSTPNDTSPAEDPAGFGIFEANPAAEPTEAAGKPQLTAKPARNTAVVVLVMASMAAVVLMNALLTFGTYGTSGESVGYWIGTLLWPFLIAYLAGGVKKWRNPTTFSVCLLFVGVLVPVMTHRKTLENLPRAEMVRELAGTKPLNSNLTSNDEQAAAAFQSFFNDERNLSRSYDEKNAAFSADIRAACTADSFASRRDMERVRNSVTAKLDLDKGVSTWLEGAPGLFQAKLDKADLSEADKRQYEAEFDSGFAASEILAARKEMMTMEDNWGKATIDLYDFALQHQRQITVSGGKVRITGGAVLLAFNMKLLTSENFHRDLVAKTAQVNAIQSANLKKLGVTMKDLGVSK